MMPVTLKQGEDALAATGLRTPCPRKLPYAPPLWAGMLSISCFFMGMSIFGTLIPFFIDDVLNVEPEWIGIVFTTQNIAATLGLLVTGILSDAIGLRKTIIIVCIFNVALLNVVGWVQSVELLLVLIALIGLNTTYALGLAWVARLAPAQRLARWMAWAVCLAQLAVSIGGFAAGAARGSDLGLVCGLMAIIPAVSASALLLARDEPRTATTNGAERGSTRAALRKAFAMPYFLCLAFCPFVQGCYMGGISSTLAPLVLKATHGWVESEVARLFQVGGFAATIAHAFVTPYLSSRPWRHRAVQALSLLNIGLLLLYAFLGDSSPAVAFAVPVVCFVTTAMCLGCCNLMVALFAKSIVPEALGALTGLTRCLFTLGTGLVPVLVVPLMKAGGLAAPSILVAALFGIKVFVLNWCGELHVPLRASSTALGSSTKSQTHAQTTGDHDQQVQVEVSMPAEMLSSTRCEQRRESVPSCPHQT